MFAIRLYRWDDQTVIEAGPGIVQGSISGQQLFPIIRGFTSNRCSPPTKPPLGFLTVPRIDVDCDGPVAEFQGHHCSRARSTENVHYHPFVGTGYQQKAAHKFSRKRCTM